MPQTADAIFRGCIEVVLEEEGVFSNEQGDPGGPTWYGIARAAHPTIPWPPTKDQAIAIYQSEYFDAHRCGEMLWQWALAVFDGVVNQPATEVIKLAQEALRVPADGIVGSGTLAAMARAPDDDFTLFLALRALAYTRDERFQDDGKGWLRRLANIAYRAGMGMPK